MAALTVDVAIVGGGLVGSFPAYFLRQRARSVAILERGRAWRCSAQGNLWQCRSAGPTWWSSPFAARAWDLAKSYPRLPARIVASPPADTCTWALPRPMRPSSSALPAWHARQASRWCSWTGRPPAGAGPSCHALWCGRCDGRCGGRVLVAARRHCRASHFCADRCGHGPLCRGSAFRGNGFGVVIHTGGDTR
jgi:choline dehydrogenase-like flavoprotein